MYKYSDERPRLFTEEGQRAFLRVRDNVFALLKKAGAVRQQEADTGSGDSWFGLAVLDRMVELSEIREVTGPGVPGQHRVFVRVGEGGW